MQAVQAIARDEATLAAAWRVQGAHLAKAHDREGLANDGDAHVLGALPLPGLHRGVRLRNVAAERADERDAVLRRGHGVGGRRIHHQASMLCRMQRFLRRLQPAVKQVQAAACPCADVEDLNIDGGSCRQERAAGMLKG